MSPEPRRYILALVCAVSSAAALAQPHELFKDPVRPTTQPTTERVPEAARQIYREIDAALETGRYGAARDTARRGLTADPQDAFIQRYFVDLHVALAREHVEAEKYSEADGLVAEALRVMPDDYSAVEVMQDLAAKRAEVPARIAEAQRYLEIEWYEPAFIIYRQARRLLPARREQWDEAFVTSAIGTGDDHYFTKNFYEAFYRYNAAVQAVQAEEASAERLSHSAAEALLCLVFGLESQGLVLNYPEAQWSGILQAAALIKSQVTRDADPARAAVVAAGRAAEQILIGMDFERTRRADEAIRQYSVVPGAALAGLELPQARAAAVAALRERWTTAGCSRRLGVWRKTDPGVPRMTQTGRFRVHHRNSVAARRLASALEFHFQRIARYLGRKEEDVPWPLPCEVHLHPDAAALAAALGGRPDQRSAVVIDASDGALRGQAIHLVQTDPMLLSVTLPHELAHVMLAAVLGYRPAPAVLVEGLALGCEAECRELELKRRLAPREQRPAVEELLAWSDSHPADPPDYEAMAAGLLRSFLGRGLLPGDVVDACRVEEPLANLPQNLYAANMAVLDEHWRGRRFATTQTSNAR